jgi:hypothetical protein
MVTRTRINHAGLARDVGIEFGKLNLEHTRAQVSFAQSPIRLFLVPKADGAAWTDMSDREIRKRLPEVSQVVAQVADDYGLVPSNIEHNSYALRIRG